MYRIQVNHWSKWQDSGDGRYSTIEEAKEASRASEFEEYYHWRVVDDNGVEYYNTIDQIRPPDIIPVSETPAAAPGEAVLGRELIAWAAERENAYACESYTVSFCIFCNAVYEAMHEPDCLHLRARALRDSE